MDFFNLVADEAIVIVAEIGKKGYSQEGITFVKVQNRLIFVVGKINT